MKKIVINSDNRRFNISSIVVGYLEENKEEVLEFEIPEKYAEYGKKACFSANGQTFAKNFDDIISNKLTITRDISQFKELDMTIEFFKIENEDEIVARTSILHILIENAIICDDDIKPDEPKIIILDNLIDEVTKLDLVVTKNEKKREEYYQEIQKKVDNGDFNGAIFTPSVDVDGNISWTNDKNLSNPTTQNIKGPKGDKGEKGDTYNLTEQDKKDISSMTVESSESTFNQYYNGKLEDFNDNVESKTTTFDNNYTSKLQSFNENATSKTNDYNTNATNKTNEFNTNASTKLQEYNTNADNKIAEYDAHSQELDNKIIDTRNELERVKNDVLETGTDTDTFIHLEDSAMAEYQELSIDGVCEQETTSGKNLLENTLLTTATTQNGVTATPNSDGSITLNGTATANCYFNIARIDFGTKSFNNYNKFSDDYKASTGSPQEIPSLVYDSSNKYTYINVPSGKSLNNFAIKPMVRLASITDDTYEPYTGGQPSPSPDYPQEIKTIENSLKITSCNKNLMPNYDFEVNNMYGLTVIAKNNKLSIKGTISKTNYSSILLYADGSCEVSQWWGVNASIKKQKGFFGNNKLDKMLSLILKGNISNSMFHLILGYETYATNTTHTSISNMEKLLDTKEKLNYICLGFSPNNIIDIEISLQLEEGTQPTPYEQHLETQITANLPEGEFIGKINDTYKDTLKVEYNETDGQYHLNLYKRVYKNDSYNGESYNYYISTTARKDGNIECGELQTGQVVYYVGDETIIDLGVVDIPITYNEITNLFTDSDLMPTINAKYYRNFISTVRNLQVNEKALKQELIDINTRLSALENAQANVVSESEVVE